MLVPSIRMIAFAFHILQCSDLRENPFSCDCVTEWLREWIANNSAIVTRPDLIVCDHPPSLNGKQISLLSKDQFICGIQSSYTFCTCYFQYLCSCSKLYCVTRADNRANDTISNSSLQCDRSSTTGLYVAQKQSDTDV